MQNEDKESQHLKSMLSLYGEIRDLIARTNTEVELSQISRIYLVISVYAFNTYKAIGLLLPELYFEQGMALTRTLWETACHLHWICKDPEKRMHLYAGYTAVELRKNMNVSIKRAEKDGNQEERVAISKLKEEFEQGLSRQFGRYQFENSKGKQSYFHNYCNMTTEQLANELGDEWVFEYETYWKMASAYAHGAPGATLFQKDDLRRTMLTGRWSMLTMLRIHELTCKQLEVPSTNLCTFVTRAEKVCPYEGMAPIGEGLEFHLF